MTNVHGLWYVASAICFLFPPLNEPIEAKTFSPSDSSFPHGCFCTLGLMLSCFLAMAAAMWGISSCRMAFVDFTNDRGDFSEFYLDATDIGDPVERRNGVGLFQWLDPYDETDWAKGSCLGYTELQLEFFGDWFLEIARCAGVLSVLGAVSISAWVGFLNCIHMGRFQIRLMSICLIALIIFNGATFAFFKSNVCTDLVSYQDESYETKCTMDQGALVIVASSMLWCVALLITCVYIKAPELDIEIGQDGEITNKFEERVEERKSSKLSRKQKREEKKLKKILEEQRAAQATIRSKLGSRV